MSCSNAIRMTYPQGMPIYEFYCHNCDTVYSFFSRTINTDKTPNCPECKKLKLKRQVSMFATVSDRKEEAGDAGMPHLDEAKLEKAMSMFAGEAGKIDEQDPRQAAQFMRKLTDATGLKMGQGMEEALSRIEKGEDPETVEREMGDIFETEEPFTFEDRIKRGSKKTGPRRDPKIYEL